MTVSARLSREKPPRWPCRPRETASGRPMPLTRRTIHRPIRENW